MGRSAISSCCANQPPSGTAGGGAPHTGSGSGSQGQRTRTLRAASTMASANMGAHAARPLDTGWSDDSNQSHALTASRPLAELSADYKGIDVLLSSRRARWHASWEELDHVLVGPRSMVFFPSRGRPCRFNVGSRRRLEPLMALLNSQHIRTQQVGSTMAWTFKV
jgi:hypothetical protein